MNPKCPHCQREMQLNTAGSMGTVKQYLCGCNHAVTYINVPNWKPPLELRKPRR